jgi:aminomuconate-semialdehyde/2-hydroxymuconate-6-semialdehyde dehydrogenase
MNLYNYIDGEKCPAIAGEWIDNINPATGNVISLIPRSQIEDAKRAVLAAKHAFAGEWSEWSVEQRASLLDRIADQIEVRLDEFASAESQDNGKPFHLAKTIDIPRAVANFRFFAGAIRHDHTGCHEMADAFNYTLRKPLGVVSLITPWNLPLYLLSWKLAPALATGNTVIAKPSEMTPTTATLLADVIDKLTVPKGVFNLLHGHGGEVGSVLTADPAVQGVSFTGGTATGRIVAASAAPLFKKMSLELGGKNSSIVFADCAFEQTVAGVTRAAFLNQGQVCLCGSRILVERSIYQAFVTALVERVKTMKIGDPRSLDSELGALISLEHREKVESFIQSAREEGATIYGGSRPDLGEVFANGAWLSPTVITGVSPESACSMDEIFGPVVVIHPFDSEEEALAIANSVEYGLAGTVWTENLRRAHRVAGKIDSGMVWVNTWLHRDLRVPFGGVKNSGVGREGGSLSLDFFSEKQNICIKY